MPTSLYHVSHDRWQYCSRHVLVVDGSVHSQGALALGRLVAEGADEHFAGVVVEVADMVAEVVLPREPFVAGRAEQI